MSTVFKHWKEYLNSSVKNKEEILRNSTLGYTNPGHERALLWVSLVKPEFSSSAIDFYRSKSEEKKVAITGEVANTLKEDVSKAYLGSLHSISAPEKLNKIFSIISLFISKRPDIGYHWGMHYIAAVLMNVFSIESDVFVMFCHIVENVFPNDYFVSKITLNAELRVFAMMAEKLRPALNRALTAHSSDRKTDNSAFVATVKKICEHWFSSLFSNFLTPPDLLRTWDVIFIHGFEIAHKIGLAILCKLERFLTNSVKQEARSLNTQMSSYTLEVAGNLTIVKMARKIEKMPVEKMIRKALLKNNYTRLSRENMINEAFSIEEDQSARLGQIRNLKSYFTKLDKRTCQDIMKGLNSLYSQGEVSRTIFQNLVTRYFSWDQHMALSLFCTFDHKRTDMMPIDSLKLSVILVSPLDITEKLRLIYMVKERVLTATDCTDHILHLQFILDPKRSYIDEENLKASLDNDEISEDDFLRIMTENPLCQAIVDFINAIDSGDYSQLKHPEFYNMHSPMQTTADASPMSDISYEADAAELENKLEQIAKERKDSLDEIEEDMNKIIEEPVDEIIQEIKENYPDLIQENEDVSENDRTDDDFEKSPEVVEEHSQRNDEGEDSRQENSQHFRMTIKEIPQNLPETDDLIGSKLEFTKENEIDNDLVSKNQGEAFQQEIDLDATFELDKNNKKRNSCSRLCSKDSCLIF